jgi:peptidyl-prolyl cis-trans isomerase SurA
VTARPAAGQRCAFAALLSGALLLAVVASPAQAQEIMRIAAVVNDEVISVYDLSARMRLVLISSGLEDTEEARNRLVPQVLRGLVDERLQLQEAKRLNLSVRQDHIDDALHKIEEQNEMAAGGLDAFLGRAGVDRATIEEQVRAGISWARLLERESKLSVIVTEEEVDEVIARIDAKRGRPQSLVSEIFLAVDSVDEAREVEVAALRLTEQIRAGANFQALAQQFSQSATAAVGGDLGWMQEGQLSPEIEQALESLEPGQITPPVRTLTGFHILQLRKRQLFAAANMDDVVVTLENLYFELPRNASEDDAQSARDLAAVISDTIVNCEDMRSLREESGATTFPLPREIRVGDLNEEIRATVGGLEIDNASPPLDIGAGVMVLIVCSRSQPTGGIDREEIRKTLVSQQLDVLARRVMRDLRRAAFIELRL